MRVSLRFSATAGGGPLSRKSNLSARGRVATSDGFWLRCGLGLLFIMTGLFAQPGRLAAQTSGVWNVTTSGTTSGQNLWGTAGNWLTSNIASGTDAVADFSQLALAGNESVHLNSARTVGTLRFGDQRGIYNWTLDNNGSAGNTLTLGVSAFSSSPMIVVNGDTATLSAVLAGNQGFTLTAGANAAAVNGTPLSLVPPSAAAGTLVLNNSSASQITGPTILAGGTLLLDFGNLAAPTNLVNTDSNSGLTLSGGSLAVKFHSGAAATTQTFSGGGTTINPGAANISVNSSGSTSSASALALAAITRNAGGSVNFALPAIGNITTSSANSSGAILGGWATVGGTDWAAVSGNGNITTLTGAGGSYANDAWDPANDTTVTTTSDFSATGAGLATNSLRFNAAGSSSGGLAVTLPTAAGTTTLLNAINSGGILVTPGTSANGATIAGGSFTSANTQSDLIVNQFDTNGALVISASIVDNSIPTTGVPVALTKSGPGTLFLSAGNNYTGGTSLNQGVLAISSMFALGGTPAAGATWLTFGGNATLQLVNLSNFAVVAGKNIVVNAGATATIDNINTAQALTRFQATISGGGGFAYISSLGLATRAFTLQNSTAGDNTYAGPTTIYGGQLALAYTSDALSITNKLNPNNTLFLGGVLSLAPNVTGAIPTAQTLSSSLNLIANSASTIATTNSAAALSGTVFNFAGSTGTGSLVRNHGSTLEFIQNDTSAALNLGAGVSNSAGILGGWATYVGTTLAAQSTADWAAVDSTGNVVVFTAAGGSYAVDTWSAGKNTDLTQSNSTAFSGATNSVRLNAASGLTVTLANGATISSGGILVTPVVGNFSNTITGGSLTSGNGADLIVNEFDPHADSTGSLTIASKIVDNGATSIGLTLSGNTQTVLPATSLVILSNASNSYTGPTTINAGVTLQTQATAVIPSTSAVVLSGNGTLNIANSSQSVGSLASLSYGTFVNGASGVTLTVGNDNTSTTFDGAIVGGLKLIKVGSGTLTLQSIPAYTGFAVTNSSSYTGGTTINGGTLSISTDANLGGGGPLVIDGAAAAASTLQATATFSLIAGRSISVAPSGALGVGTFDVSPGNTLTCAGPVTDSGTLAKVDSGTLLLTGAPTLNGGSALSVNAGTMRFRVANGAPTIGTGVNATVAPGATLELAGSIGALGTTAGVATGNLANVINDSQVASVPAG